MQSPDWEAFADFEQSYTDRSAWMARATAALSEGFCPIHSERTVVRTPRRPQAETASYCSSCRGRWETYTDDDGPDFFSFGDD